MGQYFIPVLFDGDNKPVTWLCAHNYRNGMKFGEHCFVGSCLLMALEWLIHGGLFRLVWVGDYAEKYSIDDNTYIDLYKYCTENLAPTVVDEIGEIPKYKYILNHTKRQYIDFPDLRSIHPLPMLTIYGTDYLLDNVDIAGKWCGDQLEYTIYDPPLGYTGLTYPTGLTDY